MIPPLTPKSQHSSARGLSWPGEMLSGPLCGVGSSRGRVPGGSTFRPSLTVQLEPLVLEPSHVNPCSPPWIMPFPGSVTDACWPLCEPSSSLAQGLKPTPQHTLLTGSLPPKLLLQTSFIHSNTPHLTRSLPCPPTHSFSSRLHSFIHVKDVH